ncbi:D-alanyl-D-alanine carboxypeptidase family protein [Nocardia vermiculata]|uniref:D-alanyl-D-alanine carboxypeptidase family protein n=1 Tax=Nocardia vermiculata TaxID=257274 RepID=UPI000A929FAE|nr:D-alanyl-D-alanine carboxypeptidase family protein [Nocardia vermiculata]
MPRRLAATGLLVATTAVTLVYQSAPSSVRLVGDVLRGGRAALHEGELPSGVTVFSNEYPGVANLAPDLIGALRAAAADAGAEGIEFRVNSGWRSREYQNRLLRAAVAKHGSTQAAARFVATADTSAHVTGNAVDLGSDAAAWLSAHGAAYGLCQIYRNEPWHYELRPEAIERGCPAMYPDPAHDPRMWQ